MESVISKPVELFRFILFIIISIYLEIIKVIGSQYFYYKNQYGFLSFPIIGVIIVLTIFYSKIYIKEKSIKTEIGMMRMFVCMSVLLTYMIIFGAVKEIGNKGVNVIEESLRVGVNSFVVVIGISLITLFINQYRKIFFK